MNADIANRLREIVGPRGLITSTEELRTYECDGLTNFRVMPLGVLLPEKTAQVQAILRICHGEKIPFVARGLSFDGTKFWTNSSRENAIVAFTKPD